MKVNARPELNPPTQREPPAGAPLQGGRERRAQPHHPEESGDTVAARAQAEEGLDFSGAMLGEPRKPKPPLPHRQHGDHRGDLVVSFQRVTLVRLPLLAAVPVL